MSARFKACAAALAVILPCLAHADPQPTATEIFNLRTKCASLAKARFAEDEAEAGFKGALLSYRANYSPRTWRCYYVLNVVWSKEFYTVSSLSDVQGGNVAIAEANEGKGSLSFMPKDGKSFVSVTYEEARDYIATVMSSD